jgi:hypothetical protein
MNKPTALAFVAGIVVVSLAVLLARPPAPKFSPSEFPPIGSRQTLINNYVVACRNPYFWDHAGEDSFDIYVETAKNDCYTLSKGDRGTIDDVDMPHRRICFRRDRDTAGCLWVPTANTLFAPDKG